MPLILALISIAILCGWVSSIILGVLWFAHVEPVASWSAAQVFWPCIAATIVSYLMRIFIESAST